MTESIRQVLPRNSNDSLSNLFARAINLTRDDPILFNDLILRRPPYWSRQAQIARDMTRFKTVVVATGNEVGKSYLAAGIALWFLLTRPGSLVCCTAPTQTLLSTVLFKEIGRAARSMQGAWPLDFELTDSPQASPQVFRLGPGWLILGISTNKVERFSGQHAPELLQVIDEASGVHPTVMEALDSQDPSKRLMIGNPLSPNTYFHRLYKRGQQEERDASIPEAFKTVARTISTLESPDIGLDRSARGLASQSFLVEARRNWGDGSSLWQSHIVGEFPESVSESLLEPAWVDRAFNVQRGEGPHAGRRILAVDLAGGGGGDRFVALVRDRLGVLALSVSNRVDVPQAALVVSQIARKFAIQQERIVYDANGIGRDLPRYLREYGITNAVPYFGSGSGEGHRIHRFLNTRALCGWKMRERLDPETRVWDRGRPIDPEMRRAAEEFARADVPGWQTGTKVEIQPAFAIPKNVVGEHFQSFEEELKGLERRNGPKDVIALEPKEDYCKRLGRSPDLADALLMSFWLGD